MVVACILLLVTVAYEFVAAAVLPASTLLTPDSALMVALVEGNEAGATGQPDEMRQLDDRFSTQILSDDLKVASGDTFQGDAVVYDGDAYIESGGRIAGNLIVYSGDIEIDEGGAVDGDVTAMSGDVEIAGSVGGSVAAWSGDVSLDRSAAVDGDISSLSGSISVESGAFVGGNVVRVPSLPFSMKPGIPLPFQRGPGVPSVAGVESHPQTIWQRLAAFLFRVISAAIATMLIAGLVALLMIVQPNLVTSARVTLSDQPALSFVIGILVNLTLLFLIVFLSITVCLIPVALLMVVIVFGLNLIGWTALADVVGKSVVGYGNVTVKPVVSAIIGALLMTGGLGILWALGISFFQFAAVFAFLMISSAGSGAVLLPWVTKRFNANQSGAATADATTSSEQPIDDTESSMVELEVQQSEADLLEPDGTEVSETALTAADGEAADDDFTQLKGVGPQYAQRLRDAGVHTFAQLAAKSPHEIGKILGWTAERVVSSDLIGQANALAAAS